MSAKSVDAFFEKVAQDKSLQAKLNALHKKTLKDCKEIKDKASAEVAKIAAVISDPVGNVSAFAAVA